MPQQQKNSLGAYSGVEWVAAEMAEPHLLPNAIDMVAMGSTSIRTL
jgi:hypothetical protein